MPDYKGDNSYNSASEFLKKKFLHKVQGDKTIYSHFTCATDTETMTVIFRSVADILVRSTLTECGLQN